MKFLLPVFALFLASQTAHAEKIYCFFTEPFINLTYDSDTNKVTHSAPGEQDKVGQAQVLFNKDGKIQISVVGVNNVLMIDTTKTGSDGMSDYIYPFEGVIDGNLYGGCETDHLKKKLSTLHGYLVQ